MQIPSSAVSDAPPHCRISRIGSGALLLDAAGALFDQRLQQRIWAAASDAIGLAGVLEAVPGMNNLMIVFDCLKVEAETLERDLGVLWAEARPTPLEGRVIEVPVSYGGAAGEDLAKLASRTGLDVDGVVRRHAAVTYTVAAIGAMPGFPYLSGLDPALAWDRRPSPRPRVIEGSVIIGGAQAAIMSRTAPSGWHILGHTSTKLFDPEAADPARLRPGDTLRFTIAGIEA